MSVPQISATTQTLYRAFGFVDRNHNGVIEKGKGEGYENCPKCDLNHDGVIEKFEAWQRFICNISEYPDVLKLLSENSDFNYPFKTDKELIAYTRKVVSGASSKEEAARLIFEAIIGKGKINEGTINEIEKLDIAYDLDGSKRPSGCKNSEQVFKETDPNGKRFALCLEYAFLFVAMARIAGLKASVVDVRTDENGKNVRSPGHACAAVTINGRLILVDPAYKKFDIKHKEFAVLNDASAAAYLNKNCAAELIKKGKLADAERMLLTAIEIDPNNPDLYYDLGMVYFKKGMYDIAIAHFQTALKLDPRDTRAHYNLAEAYSKLGDLGSAAEHYEKVVELAPVDLGVFTMIARFLIDHGKYKEALKVSESYIRVNQPKGSYVYQLIAEINVRQGKYDLAVEQYKKACEINPPGAQALLEDICMLMFERANRFMKEGDYGQAIEAFKKITEIAPERVQKNIAFVALGEIYLSRANYPEAISNCQNAIRMDPTDGRAYYVLGEAYKAAGQKREARRAFRKASELGFEPDSE